MAQGLSLSDAISGYQGGLKDHAADVTKQIGEAKDTYESKIATADKAEAALDPNALTPPKMEPPPNTQGTTPMHEWGSAAMAIAALGGMLTRRPLINSLNAAAGVMNAYKQQDAAAAQSAYDTWKVTTANAVKMAQFSIDAYKTALTKIDSDKRAALTDFTTTAKALGDENAAYVAEHYGIDAAIKYTDALQAHVDRMAKTGEEMSRQKPKLDAQLAMVNGIKNLQAARKTGDPAKIAAATQVVKDANEQLQAFKSGAGGDVGNSLSDEDLKSMAEQYLAGDKSVVTSLGYGSAGAANRARLQDIIRKSAKAQGMSGGDIAAHMAEFQGMTAGERTLSTTQARIGLGAAEIQKLEPQVLEASKQLERTNYPSFNSLIQAGQHETGDPALKNLAVRLQGLKSAFSQVLTRGGVPTDSARATTDELFNTKDPVPVMKAAMDAMNAETGAIEQAPVVVRKQLRENISSDKPDSTRGPAPAHLHGKSIWPEGDHWVYEDGSPAK